MRKGRTAPERTSEQQKEHDRRAALMALDIPAMRAWAAQHAVGLLGDDRTVLISMHETRAVDSAIPKQAQRDSIAWLKAEHSESVVLRPAQPPGPQYGKAKG